MADDFAISVGDTATATSFAIMNAGISTQCNPVNVGEGYFYTQEGPLRKSRHKDNAQAK